MIKTRRKPVQINNLKVAYNKLYGVWVVKSPDGRSLEQFKRKRSAIKWAKGLRDFVIRR